MAAKRPPKRLPPNTVSKALTAGGGRSEVERALHVSTPTLHRWRKAGRVPDAVACLILARLAAPKLKVDELTLARRLAGLE